MGVAAGMAACGRVPFVNTMAAFAASRALEAIKIDIAYNRLPVRIMATHGGLAAGHLGPTHQALEDLAVDAGAARNDRRGACRRRRHGGVRRAEPGPGRTALRPARPQTDPGAARSSAAGHRAGADAAGGRRRGARELRPYPVLACLAAAEVLAGQGIEATVLNMHTLRPFDARGAGGRGAAGRRSWSPSKNTGAAAASAARWPRHWRRQRPYEGAEAGRAGQFVDEVGNQEHLVEHYDLTAERVVRVVRTALDTAARSGKTD